MESIGGFINPHLQELSKFLAEINAMAANPHSSQFHIERLLSHTYLNPYEVLQLPYEASEEEIKTQFRKMSLLVHPDKADHARAADAFFVLDKAYKTLQDGDKRKMYQRVMREAKERVDYERKRENKRREHNGLPILPEDTYENDLKDMCQKLFEEIEERKKHFERLEQSAKKRAREEAEIKKVEEEIKREETKAWETLRDKRVESWRKFTNKESSLKGKKKKNQVYKVRAPLIRMEERPASAPKTESSKPMGIIDDYKKSWK